jgi:hypothetical protein
LAAERLCGSNISSVGGGGCHIITSISKDYFDIRDGHRLLDIKDGHRLVDTSELNFKDDDNTVAKAEVIAIDAH